MMPDMPKVALGRPATYDDLVAVPDHLVAEIVDGELWTSPRPAPRHAVAHSRLMGELTPPFDRGRGGPGGWLILLEPELHLGDHALVPDIAGWRRERMPRVPQTPYFALAPDWVCEILSPSTGRIDRSAKMRLYAAADVGNLWIVDPSLQTLEVYRLEAGRWVVLDTHAGDALIRAEPFDALELRLGRWWAP